LSAGHADFGGAKKVVMDVGFFFKFAGLLTCVLYWLGDCENSHLHH
jgi:hypothetical protein